MILIIDEERTKRALDLKYAIESRGIPVAFTTADRIKNHPVFTAAVAFVSSEYALNMISVRLGKCLLLCINKSGNRIYNKDVVFFEDHFGNEADFVFSTLKERLGFNPKELRVGDLTIGVNFVKVGLSYMNLTVTERRILVLAAFLAGRDFDVDTVLASCFPNSGRGRSDKVSVHICNLNKKAKTAMGRPIIRCKRGVGYTLDMPI